MCQTRVSTPESGSDAQVEVVGRPAGNRLPVGIPFAVGWHRRVSQRRKSGPNLVRLSWTCLLGAPHLHLRMRRRETCVKQSAARAEAVTAMRVLLWSRSRRQTLEVCVGFGCLQNAVISRDHHEMVVTPYGIYPAWTRGKKRFREEPCLWGSVRLLETRSWGSPLRGGGGSSRPSADPQPLGRDHRGLHRVALHRAFSRDWP